MINWILGAALSACLLFGIGYLLWMLNDVVDALVDYRCRQIFRDDLRGALKHSQPSWEQVVAIAESRNLNHRSAYSVVRNLLRDVLTGSEPELTQHRELLEQYLARYKAAEPFSGLPSETRVHLERVQEKLGLEAHVLEPLTARIRGLVSVYEKDKARQRLYSISSVILGIIGVAFAAYAHFVPLRTINGAGAGAMVEVPTAQSEK